MTSVQKAPLHRLHPTFVPEGSSIHKTHAAITYLCSLGQLHVWHLVLHWEPHSESRSLWEQTTCIVQAQVRQGTATRDGDGTGSSGSSLPFHALALETHRSKEREHPTKPALEKPTRSSAVDPQQFPPRPQMPTALTRIPQPQPRRRHRSPRPQPDSPASTRAPDPGGSRRSTAPAPLGSPRSVRRQRRDGAHRPRRGRQNGGGRQADPRSGRAGGKAPRNPRGKAGGLLLRAPAFPGAPTGAGRGPGKGPGAGQRLTWGGGGGQRGAEQAQRQPGAHGRLRARERSVLQGGKAAPRRRRASRRLSAGAGAAPRPRPAAKLSRRQSAPAPQPARRSSLSRPRRRAARGEQARAPGRGAEPRHRLRPRPCGCPAVLLGDGARGASREAARGGTGGVARRSERAPWGCGAAGARCRARREAEGRQRTGAARERFPARSAGYACKAPSKRSAQNSACFSRGRNNRRTAGSTNRAPRTWRKLTTCHGTDTSKSRNGPCFY